MTTSARHLLPIALTLGCLYAHAQSASDAAIQRAISANQVAGVHQHDGALLGVAKSYFASSSLPVDRANRIIEALLEAGAQAEHQRRAFGAQPNPDSRSRSFVCDVGPGRSGPFPWGRLFVLSRVLTLPGPGNGLHRPKTSKTTLVAFFGRRQEVWGDAWGRG